MARRDHHPSTASIWVFQAVEDEFCRLDVFLFLQDRGTSHSAKHDTLGLGYPL